MLKIAQNCISLKTDFNKTNKFVLLSLSLLPFLSVARSKAHSQLNFLQKTNYGVSERERGKKKEKEREIEKETKKEKRKERES